LFRRPLSLFPEQRPQQADQVLHCDLSQTAIDLVGAGWILPRELLTPPCPQTMYTLLLNSCRMTAAVFMITLATVAVT
jgi:hypothetical protein